LDIAFREDESRIRKGNGAENFAILRHIALNLLKKEDTAKICIKNKRLKAGWDGVYLEKGQDLLHSAIALPLDAGASMYALSRWSEGKT